VDYACVWRDGELVPVIKIHAGTPEEAFVLFLVGEQEIKEFMRFMDTAWAREHSLWREDDDDSSWVEWEERLPPWPTVDDAAELNNFLCGLSVPPLDSEAGSEAMIGLSASPHGSIPAADVQAMIGRLFPAEAAGIPAAAPAPTPAATAAAPAAAPATAAAPAAPAAAPATAVQGSFIEFEGVQRRIRGVVTSEFGDVKLLLDPLAGMPEAAGMTAAAAPAAPARTKRPATATFWEVIGSMPLTDFEAECTATAVAAAAPGAKRLRAGIERVSDALTPWALREGLFRNNDTASECSDSGSDAEDDSDSNAGPWSRLPEAVLMSDSEDDEFGSEDQYSGKAQAYPSVPIEDRIAGSRALSGINEAAAASDSE
jgi:hypothetical protein